MTAGERSMRGRGVIAGVGALLMLALATRVGAAASSGYAQRPDVRAFVEQMSREHGFSAAVLLRLFAQVHYQPEVIAAMTRPIVSPPTYDDFASRFLDPERIEAGAGFWRAHADALDRARRQFEVPPEIIVAILGVETYYGRNTGRYRVVDALTTLAFDYPRRADFFRGELEQFLLLAREQGISPLVPKGSYAGAIGLPQFMPGSIRAHAIDFDGDGRIDLANDADDAIGSVAQYLAGHGWRPGQPVMTPVRIETADLDGLTRRFDAGIAERRPLAAWTRDGVTGFAIPGDLGPDPVGLLMLEGNGSPTYWLTFENWYVLTRYNRSRLYASAVWQLAERLRERAAP
ncbi:MAG TPA: lytic murein transglycosylase B [Casimicrobiaceae bacterium]|nr:lytic murein transglycosylase B [Casimicrobiaceae bacterium]